MLLGIKLYLKNRTPGWKGFWFKILFKSKKLQVGKGFRCDTWPDIQITDHAKIIIGDNVYFRRNVELRAHGGSTVQFEGDNRIDRGVRVLGANNASVKIRSGARIGLYSVLNGGDSIELGKKVLLSGFVYVQTSMHNFKETGYIQDQGYTHSPVVLEENVWCGAHVVILPGVTMKTGAIAGSNAVVTKDVKEHQVVAGIPAKPLEKK